MKEKRLDRLRDTTKVLELIVKKVVIMDTIRMLMLPRKEQMAMISEVSMEAAGIEAKLEEMIIKYKITPEEMKILAKAAGKPTIEVWPDKAV